MIGALVNGRTTWTKRCASCGLDFRTRRSHARTCSGRCRKRLARGIVAPDLSAESGPLVLSLCDYTGVWSQPYRSAGYRVRQVDLRHGGDVRLLQAPKEPVRGVLAAPDCAQFCRLGTATRGGEPALLAALALVDACIRVITACRPRWWALENPPGRLEDYLGPPAYQFEPFHHGDAHTKLTHVWGEFTPPQRSPVEPTVRRQTTSTGSYTLRAQTPPGFAAAFFEANP